MQSIILNSPPHLKKKKKYAKSSNIFKAIEMLKIVFLNSYLYNILQILNGKFMLHTQIVIDQFLKKIVFCFISFKHFFLLCLLRGEWLSYVIKSCLLQNYFFAVAISISKTFNVIFNENSFSTQIQKKKTNVS